jgi:dienelactone hydrolase
MNMQSASWKRQPILIKFQETQKFLEVYGFAGSQGHVQLEGQHFLPDTPSDTVFIFMHPSSAMQLLPLPASLADAGLHILCANSRYTRNDTALIMEKVAVDLGHFVRWAKSEGGYSKVVIVGWSGGGALSLFYQGQAEEPSITHTPAGDAYDLTEAGLIPGDAVIFIAAPGSRAEMLTDALDPSVIDEADPDRRLLELDIYDPRCPNQPPYSPEFIETFRAAQRARSRKITDWVETTLAKLKAAGETERGFVVHRTWCDVRFLDPSIDPNGRDPASSTLGDARTTNSAPAGLARYSSLRSWLSQWSIDRSQAKGPPNAARIKHVPVLQIENGADDGVPTSHSQAVYAALAAPDKAFHTIEGANHYFAGQPEKLAECIALIKSWSRERGLLEPA